MTPFVTQGQVVGLLGGSFDPPHEGHVQITREALRRFGLDRLWWLVSPGNPLKAHGPAPMADRPGVRFVWLMGADNLAQFHRWQEWERIMEMVPVGVLARPGARIAAQMSKAARVYATDRLEPGQARRLGRAAPPAWCFVNMPLVAQSSSAIRARGEWGA